MTIFEKEYFQKFEFSQSQIDRYFKNALRDLEIARSDPFCEVRFMYCYQALIKAGIAVIAKQGRVKIRSVSGHHIKILAKMSGILKDEDIFVIGNAMRMKRNNDFYGGGEFISAKEIKDYLAFVEEVITKARKMIKETE